MKNPFAAYIDYATHIHPSLVLVGGVYNFEMEKNDIVLCNEIITQKPHLGCMVKENDNPYLFLLLRLREPLARFESCEVKIQKSDRIIGWRMHGDRLFSVQQISKAQEVLQTFTHKTQLELVAMQEQYNKRFQTEHALDFF